MAFGLMNSGFPVRNEFKFSGFDGKVYFLVINLNVFSSYIKKHIKILIKLVKYSVIFLFFFSQRLLSFFLLFLLFQEINLKISKISFYIGKELSTKDQLLAAGSIYHTQQ